MVTLNNAWQRSLVLAGAFIFIYYVGIQFRTTLPASYSSHRSSANASSPPTSTDRDNLESIIQAIWSRLVVPITAESFVDVTGKVHSLPAQPIFTESLGKKLVLIDVDTRPFDEEGELFNQTTPTWDNLHRLSAGALTHYLYALIHGYDYKFVRSPNFEDRQGGWTKVTMTRELLKTHDFVVMIDEDAEMANPELPLEWLFNYWNITSNIAMALAVDPDQDPNYDSKGNVMLNTGFVINQAKAPLIEEIYQVWADCPEETLFPGCAEWKHNGFREQSAFSEHVRYNYLDKDVIRTLPCNEANGCPNSAHYGCTGVFVRHYWIDKKLVKPAFSGNIMQALLPLFTRAVQGEVLDLRGKTLQGVEVLDS